VVLRTAGHQDDGQTIPNTAIYRWSAYHLRRRISPGFRISSALGDAGPHAIHRQWGSLVGRRLLVGRRRHLVCGINLRTVDLIHEKPGRLGSRALRHKVSAVASTCTHIEYIRVLIRLLVSCFHGARTSGARLRRVVLGFDRTEAVGCGLFFRMLHRTKAVAGSRRLSCLGCVLYWACARSRRWNTH
jgi:hypothetical protein